MLGADGTEPEGTEPAADVRSVRRILVGLLLAAALAAAAALTLGLRSSGNGEAGADPQLPEIFPGTFTETGFVDDSVRLGPTAQAPAGTARLSRTLEVGASTTAWVVARCDRGRIALRAGGIESTGRCTGEPVGIVALGSSDPQVTIVATVSIPQQQAWGVAIYR